MKEIDKRILLSVTLFTGCLWGLSEAALGMYMRGTCAFGITGSVMTGSVALFSGFLSSYSRHWRYFLGMLAIVLLLKLSDAFLLGLPVLHGAIANPMFAIFCEVLAVYALLMIIKPDLLNKVFGKALTGGLYAVLAANLFPLVGFCTGIPACKVAGTGYPLALYYLPITVGISIVTLPLGAFLGEKSKVYVSREAGSINKKFSYAFELSSIAFVLALVLIRVL